MKHWHFIILVIFLSACDKDIEEQKYEVINMLNDYSYISEKYPSKNVAPEVYELFIPTTHLINSIEALQENPLFEHYPDSLQKEFLTCNFEHHTLVLTSSAYPEEVTKLEYRLFFNKYSSEYEYNQAFYSVIPKDEIDFIYLILTAFTIQQIPENTPISFTSFTNFTE